MFEVRQTEQFAEWLDGLRDRKARARIAVRLSRVEQNGHLGDVKPVGDGVFEMRIDYGPGYRLYYTRSGKAVVFMLCGGDKNTQARDIATARRMAKEI
jgi:putative addiction module killer protein